MKKSWLIIIGVGFLFLISCKSVTPEVELSNSTSGSGTILFQDDFSNTASGWDRLQTSDGMPDYEGGKYHIVINRPDYDFFANPSQSFADVHIEVEATRVAGSTNNNFGIICRFVDSNDFYVGMISSDGFFGIFKVKNGDYQLLGMESMGKSDAIKQGSDANLIRLDCKGSILTLYANGVQLDTRQDGDFTQGDTGLLADAYKTPGVHIAFEKFVVYQP